jgi:hypothetical protein
MWSLGVTSMNMVGQLAHMIQATADPPRLVFMASIAARWLGGPAKGIFKNCKWPPPLHMLRYPKPQLDTKAVNALGEIGVDFVLRLLEWDPDVRYKVEQAAAHAFLSWDVCRCLGPVPFQGKRHPWNLVSYQMESEVLEWLRSDPALKPAYMKDVLGVNFVRRAGKPHGQEC